MKHLTALVLLGFALAPGLDYRPVSVSFIPPVSTNGLDCGRVTSDVSFNVIGGWIGGVRGFELGGVFNVDRYYLEGCQIAGAFNLVGGSLLGVQLGTVNLVLGLSESDEPAAPTFRHIALGRGAQVGTVNVNLTDFAGIQVGNVNLVRRVRGVQLGNCNLAFRAIGAIVGNANLAADCDGFMLGNVNLAHRGRGFLLGNVNVCGELDGEALGNVSIIGNGYNLFSVWADETGIPQVGAKLGSRHVHNLFAFGAAPFADPELRWLCSYGLGVHFPLGRRFFLDADIAAQAVSTGTDPLDWEWEDWHVITKLRPQFGWNVTRHFALVAGPTLAWLMADGPVNLPAFTIGDAQGRAFGDNLWYRLWGGLMLGVQVR
jgi:hypothetical protein